MNLIKDDRPVIYSAVFGGYDHVPFSPSKEQLDKYHFLLFSDCLDHVEGWELIKISSDQPVLSNRKIKMFPWEYFTAHHSFYIDGHVSFGKNYEELLDSLLASSDIFAIQKHRAGGNVASELVRCVDNRKLGRSQLQKVLDSGIVFTPPSVECGFIYRDSSSEKVHQHANKWWELFNNICPRDQLWVSQAAIETGLDIKVLESSFNDGNEYLKVGIHKNARLKNLISRFGKAIYVIKTGLLL